jgi:hypothetical protein
MPPDAAGHELRQPDRAGERAAPVERIEARVAREQQVLLELLAEIGRTARVVERERR